jgi:transposase-like protein
LAVTSPSIPDLSKATLHGFIQESIMPGSTVRTDGFPSYPGLEEYNHASGAAPSRRGGACFARVHLVISQLKRWLLGTHQGAVGYDHLDDYLNEFMFRFNRRKSASRGKLFYRLAQQAVQIDPVPFASLIKPQQVGPGGVK